MSGTSSSIRTKLWWNSHWLVLYQNCVQQSRSSTKMATTVQLRCYWKQIWSRWAITGSWEPLVYLFVSSSSISPKFPLFNHKYIYLKRVNSYWYGGPHLISDFDIIISVYMLYILCVKCKFSLSIMLCQFVSSVCPSCYANSSSLIL